MRPDQQRDYLKFQVLRKYKYVPSQKHFTKEPNDRVKPIPMGVGKLWLVPDCGQLPTSMFVQTPLNQMIDTADQITSVTSVLHNALVAKDQASTDQHWSNCMDPDKVFYISESGVLWDKPTDDYYQTLMKSTQKEQTLKLAKCLENDADDMFDSADIYKDRICFARDQDSIDEEQYQQFKSLCWSFNASLQSFREAIKHMATSLSSETALVFKHKAEDDLAAMKEIYEVHRMVLPVAGGVTASVQPTRDDLPNVGELNSLRLPPTVVDTNPKPYVMTLELQKARDEAKAKFIADKAKLLAGKANLERLHLEAEQAEAELHAHQLAQLNLGAPEPIESSGQCVSESKGDDNDDNDSVVFISQTRGAAPAPKANKECAACDGIGTHVHGCPRIICFHGCIKYGNTRAGHNQFVCPYWTAKHLCKCRGMGEVHVRFCAYNTMYKAVYDEHCHERLEHWEHEMAGCGFCDGGKKPYDPHDSKCPKHFCWQNCDYSMLYDEERTRHHPDCGFNQVQYCPGDHTGTKPLAPAHWLSCPYHADFNNEILEEVIESEVASGKRKREPAPEPAPEELNEGDGDEDEDEDEDKKGRGGHVNQ
jgi:hypothetical protein